MSDLVLRDVPRDVVATLERRAVAHGRNIEEELRTILEETLAAERGAHWARIDELREELKASGRTFADSTPFVRESRDER